MQKAKLRIAAPDQQKALPRKLRFTVPTLNAMKCPAGKPRVFIYDSESPGLCLQVTAKGSKSFYFYKWSNGKAIREHIGGYPDIAIEQARKTARAMSGKLASGIDIQADRKLIRDSIDLQELFDRWHSEYAIPNLRRSTVKTHFSRFNVCFSDWKHRKLTSIRPDDVIRKHGELGRLRGTTNANRGIQLLRQLFNFSKLGINPAANRIVKFTREPSRTRYVTREEYPRFYRAVEACSDRTISDYIHLSLRIGARKSNMLAMEWADIDLNQRQWTIPADQSKNHQELIVHLAPRAIEILRRRSGNGSEYVFQSHGQSGHLIEPKGQWKKILAAAKMPDLRIHDLRRTLGSWMAATGASMQVIGGQLGHTDASVTAIYSRLSLDTIRVAVDAANAAFDAAENTTSA